MSIYELHVEMVSRLRKPGVAILKDMTAERCDMLHMAGCIAEEAGELFGAIKKHVFYNKSLDIENVIEELGDLEFYMEGLRQILQLKRDEILAGNVEKLDNGRYKTGSYSDDQAQQRMDKVKNGE